MVAKMMDMRYNNTIAANETTLTNHSLLAEQRHLNVNECYELCHSRHRTGGTRMIYCMSDIHGEYELYLAMLERIGFSDADTMYVIGDVIDRGKRGVDVALDMMARPNAIFLQGNHEDMCLDLMLRGLHHTRDRWFMNHGSPTRSDLVYRRSPEICSAVLQYFADAPSFLDVTVNKRRFHLVHGYPADTTHDRLWLRPDVSAPAPFPDTTVIVGHTPTILLNGDDGGPLRVWQGDGVIGIDCGCGHKSPLARLACLRLDDMQVFYVDQSSIRRI